MVPPVLDDASHARRLKALFGNEFASAAQAVELATPRLRVFGFVAGPALARSQSDLQFPLLRGAGVENRGAPAADEGARARLRFRQSMREKGDVDHRRG